MKTPQEILDRIELCEEIIHDHVEIKAGLPLNDIRRNIIRSEDADALSVIMDLTWVLTGDSFGRINRKEIRRCNSPK
jgi:hypothetical protein